MKKGQVKKKKKSGNTFPKYFKISKLHLYNKLVKVITIKLNKRQSSIKN